MLDKLPKKSDGESRIAVSGCSRQMKRSLFVASICNECVQQANCLISFICIDSVAFFHVAAKVKQCEERSQQSVKCIKSVANKLPEVDRATPFGWLTDLMAARRDLSSRTPTGRSEVMHFEVSGRGLQLLSEAGS